jgi:hypothetical protein
MQARGRSRRLSGTRDDDGRGGLSRPAPDEPPLKEHAVDYAAAWAKHPLRDHPRFRLARPAERDNGTTLVVFVGRST